ncbi:MAG: response regulator, partial [Pseudomonadota bacterium]
MNASLKHRRIKPPGPFSGSSPALGSILVVNAEAALARRIERSLSRRFALVEIAQSISEAEKVRQRCAFDLLISAAELPDGSGLTWVESLREQGVEAQVILLADQGDVETAIAAVRA